jgi:hypothetical protein
MRTSLHRFERHYRKLAERELFGREPRWHGHPQGGFTMLQGDESMKRLQYFDHALWPAALEIPQLLRVLSGKALQSASLIH